jgi:iron complex outermembrane receptor protein
MALFCAANAFSLPAVPVLAQGLVLEEVIVTARKREESLQDTPVTVTALSGRALAEAGIAGMGDLNNIVPGIDVQSGNGSSGKVNVFIRGVGQRNTGVNLDSGVGVYLDGVYIARSDGGLLDINDTQSVQVLRGPQGTLFGKNTTGGALVYQTNRPGEEFEGSLLVRLGEYNRRDAQGMINIPLTDNLFTRLSLSSIKRDGFSTNVSTGSDYGDEERLSGIWQLRWLASDDLTADLSVNYSQQNQFARGQKCLPAPGFEGWQEAALNQLLAASQFERKTLAEQCAYSDSLDIDEWTGDLGRESTYFSEGKGVALTLDWAFSDEMSLKSITAWRQSTGNLDNDLDGLPFISVYQSMDFHPQARPQKTNQYSQEFQLTGSAFNGKLDYVSGLYWFRESTADHAEISEVTFAELAFPGIYVLRSNKKELRARNEAWAVYTQADWNFDDNWRLTAGLRFTSEERRFERTVSELDPATLTTSETGSVIPLGGAFLLTEPDTFNMNWGFMNPVVTPPESVDDSELTPMMSLQYRFDGDGFIDSGAAYFTASRGYRSGGISEAPTGDFETFAPETVDNYELGLKIDAWQQRLRINAALFYSDYKDRQLTTIVINQRLQTLAPATFNAPESTIKGLEIETVLLPYKGLEVLLNVSWNKGDIQVFEDEQLVPAQLGAGQNCADVNGVMVGNSCVQQNTIDRSDEDLVRLPEQTVFAALQYHFEGDFGTLTSRIQYSRKKDIEHCFDRNSCLSGLWRASEKDVSARLTWQSPGKQFSFSVYANNLTDERYLIGGQPLVDTYGFGTAVYNAPRMLGAELSLRW